MVHYGCNLDVIIIKKSADRQGFDNKHYLSQVLCLTMAPTSML